MSLLRIIAVIFGIVMLAVGVLGFVPSLVPGGLLLGFFEVNVIHNLVHIATGLVALAAGQSDAYAKLFFQIFGIIYGIVTVLGFVLNGNLMLMHVNTLDNFLHLGITIIALYLGFIFKSKSI